MISQIGLTNFKCFQGEHIFPLSRFNLLTGINGRGKSTLLQSLLLMKQTTDYNKNSNYIVFNGSCVQLGTFDDIKNSFAHNEDEVKFNFGLFENEESNYEAIYTFKQDDNDNSIGIIDTYSEFSHFFNGSQTCRLREHKKHSNFYYLKLGEDVLKYEEEGNDNWRNYSSDLFFENLSPKYDDENQSVFKFIQYISADRIGPKNYYEIQNINKNFSWVGARGENTASILLKKKDNEVNKRLYLGEDTNSLLQQTEEWLNFIFDGAKININTEGGVVALSYNTKQGGERYKPTNVGFGYSYILPIVVAGLIAHNDEILIIENPEAHLHPRAQHKLTQFLAKVAATGVQIFVESHSEHILNALRICTIEHEGQEKILNNTDLSILYFQDNPKTPCVQIPIDEKGGIEEWPEGFFDQTDKDFKILFGF